MSQSKEGLTARAAWLVAARLISVILTIAVPLLLVRRLDKHDFGIYKQAFMVANTALTLAPLGFGMNVFYFIPRNPNSKSSVMSNTVLHLAGVGLITAAFFTLFPGIIEVLTKSNQGLEYAPWIGAIAGLWIVGFFMDFAPIVNNETRLASIALVTFNFARAICLFVAATMFGTVKSLLIAATLHGAGQVLVLLAYLRKRYPTFPGSFDFSLWRAQVGYIGSIVLPVMVGVLQTDLTQYLVALRFDPATFAVYSIGWMNIPITQILIESAGAVMVPQVGHLEATGNRKEIIRLTFAGARKLALVFFPLFALLAVVSREFIVFLNTEAYASSTPIFLANISFLPFVIFMVDPISRAFPTHQRTQLAIRLSVLITVVATLWFVTLSMGTVAAAITAVSGLILDRVLLSIYWFGKLDGKVSDIGAPSWGLGKVALSATGAAAAGFMVRMLLPQFKLVRIMGIPFSSVFWVLAIVSIVFGVTYFVLLLALRVPTDQEKGMVLRRLRLGKPASAQA